MKVSKEEIKLKEFDRFFMDEPELEDEDQKERESLIGAALKVNSPYAAKIRAYEIYGKCKDNRDDIDEALFLFKHAANYGYSECMHFLATEDVPGVTKIEQFAYLKLSNFFFEKTLDDYDLNDDDLKMAEQLYSMLKSEMTCFYERGEMEMMVNENT